MNPLLSYKEVAKLLHVSIPHVYRMAKRGDFPYIRFPGSKVIRFREEDIREFIEKGMKR